MLQRTNPGCRDALALPLNTIVLSTMCGRVRRLPPLKSALLQLLGFGFEIVRGIREQMRANNTHQGTGNATV
jgi:hypothetical protein